MAFNIFDMGRAMIPNKTKLMLIYDFLIDLDAKVKDLADKYKMSESKACITIDKYFDLKTNMRVEALKLGNAEAFAEYFKEITL